MRQQSRQGAHWPAGCFGFAFLAVLLAGSLSSCGLFQEATPPPPCPTILTHQDASTLTRFREGPGRDLIDVEFEAEIIDARGGCIHDIDDETRKGTVEVEFVIELEVARGPADTDREVSLGYFVAIPQFYPLPEGHRVFPTKVTFPGNRTRLTMVDGPVHLDIPLQAGQVGEDFTIVVGFDVTPEELDFNRQQARGGRP